MPIQKTKIKNNRTLTHWVVKKISYSIIEKIIIANVYGYESSSSVSSWTMEVVSFSYEKTKKLDNIDIITFAEKEISGKWAGVFVDG